MNEAEFLHWASALGTLALGLGVIGIFAYFTWENFDE